MQIIRNILFTFTCIVLTTILLLIVFLFSGKIVGNIIGIVGFVMLLTLIVFAAISLGKGSFFKLKNRFSISLALIYLMVTSLVLCVISFYNFALHRKYDELSAGDKFYFIQGLTVIGEISHKRATNNFLVQNHQNIKFIYHPSTKHQVDQLIHSLEKINKLEEDIFGEGIYDDNPLEVILYSKKQFYLFYPDNVEGTYDSNNKRIVIYTEKDNEVSTIGYFAHEYTHYLLDIYSSKIELNYDAIPIWYNEGISEYIRWQMVDSIKKPNKIDTDLPFTKLSTFKEWSSAFEKTDVYYLARKAIQYIVGDQNNVKVLSDILLHQKNSDSFEVSFEQITGIKLSTLHQTIFSFDEYLNEALRVVHETDFDTAENMYTEILKRFPDESIAWHQFALLLEKQSRWDEAIEARYNVIKFSSEDAPGFQNLSYLLTVTDPKAAVEMAEKSLELTKKDPYGNVSFVQEWVNEISTYSEMLKQGNDVEAYRSIFQSKQLSIQAPIMEELKKQAKEKFPEEF